MRTLRKPYRHAQSGMSLVELMVAMVLGLLLTLAATAVYLGSRTNYSTIDDTTALDEKGRFALDTIVRIVRQSAWTNYAGNSAPATNPASGPIAQAPGGIMPTTVALSPTISGVDNCASPGQDASLNLSCLPGTTNPVNKSDVLQVRFFGSGTPSDRTVADNSMIDCSGNGVAEPQAWEDADLARGFARFFVAPDPKDPSGNPQLMCGYRARDASNKEISNTAITSVPIISGVEVFQVLYGVDTNNDYIPDRYLPATDVLALATKWQTVVSLKIALVLAGDTMTGPAPDVPTFQLFGTLYGGDSTVNDATYKPTTQLQRLRRQYSVTVQLRNVATCRTCSPS